MIFEKIKSEGISHYSYFIASGLQAAVIDARRDINVYLDLSKNNNVKITHIFETHRNEDYVVGSLELSKKVGAEIFHGAKMNFNYGNSVKEGDKFNIGMIEVEILETPGHTDESISIILKDRESADDDYIIFTGDTLFSGDLGRIDLYGKEESKRLASNLYESLFNKILKLNESIIVCPAHGPGSICGAGIKGIEFTTIGFEKRNNPILQLKDKKQFVDYKTKEKLERPPYFVKMEKYNKEGPPLLNDLPRPSILNVYEIKKYIENGAQIIDTRDPISFAGGHIPHSINIWQEGLPNYAGWILSYDRPIIIIKDNCQNIEDIVKYLVRVGYDDIRGYLAKDISTWIKSGENINKIEQWTIHELKKNLNDNSLFILDVRDETAIKKDGYIKDSINIYVGHLKEKLHKIPTNKKIAVFCDSGNKTSIATSILENNGFTNIVNILGGMNAWKKADYPRKMNNYE